MINIPSTVQDPAYRYEKLNLRYKMPKMQLKIEGKGNGIKTNIVNLGDVAKYLRVPTQYPLKYLGAEFGCISEYKNKTVQTCILNGARTYGEMLQKLDRFIERFVLCRKCSLPEIKISIKKGLLYGDCRACGGSELIQNAHKLVSFILKNPPKDFSEFKDDAVQDEKAGKGKKKGKKGKKEKAETKPEEAKDIEKDAVQKEEVKEEEEPPLQELVASSGQIIDDAIERIKNFKGTPEQVATELRNLQLSLGYGEDLKYHVALQGLFGNGVRLIKNMKTYGQLFKKWMQNDATKEENQFAGQLLFMLALQHFLCETNADTAVKLGSTIAKVLYDTEVLSEEFYLKWHARELKLPRLSSLYSKTGSKRLREIMGEFITWLKEAAEEEEDEEEEEEEDEKANQEDEKIALQKKLIAEQLEKQEQQKSTMNGESEEQEKSEEDTMDVMKMKVEEEDFDIDDI